MRELTREWHSLVSDLGERLGFRSSREVDDSLLRVHLDPAADYTPRVDVLWSMPLTKDQRSALSWVTGIDDIPELLPVAGWEIEGTSASTKTIAADVANLTALGVPFGFIVVNDDPKKERGGEPRLYVRAVRAIRTVRYHFGHRHIVPINGPALAGLSDKALIGGPAAASTPVRSRGSTGGERGDWAAKTRRRLRTAGEEAGFAVTDGWTNEHSAAAFESHRMHREDSLTDLAVPGTGQFESVRHSRKFFTESVMDVAWRLSLPAGFATFARAIGEGDRTLQQHGILDPSCYRALTVMVAELENSAGKHAGGGLLNLASHGLLGVMLAQTEDGATTMLSALRTYKHAMGLRNVFVRRLSDV